VTVTIGNDEAKTIDVSVSRRPEVSGSISIEDWAGPQKPDLRALMIHLLPAKTPPLDATLLGYEHDLPFGRALPDADGNFTVTNVLPGEYRVVVTAVQNGPGGPGIALLRGAYVKSIQLGGRDVLSTSIAVERASPERLNIVLGTTVAALDGRVAGTDGAAAAAARVVLVPNDRSRLDLYQTVTASSTGRFQFQFLAPGGYKVFAWERPPEGAWFDPDFLTTYEDLGMAVDIVPDSAEAVELKAITR
jgi:hypothetical protein